MTSNPVQSGRPHRWRVTAWLVTALVALALAGCATGMGGYPGYPGGGSRDDYGYGSERLLATVQDVDLQYGRLLVTADTGGGYGGQSRLTVFFDRGTRLVYQGQVYPVAGLERGDRISIDAVRSGGRLVARQIEVVQNVRDAYGGSYYGGELRGAVSFVDPRAQTIVITRGGYSGRQERVRYDRNTRVEYRGRLYRPDQLQRGDVVSIQARPIGNEWLASRILVEIDARSR